MIYKITIRNPPITGKATQFKCQAANDEEASEQLFSVYPDCEVITYTTKKEHEVYFEATREYAFMLRCEGATYKQIAQRLNTAQSTAEQKVKAMSRRLNWAMKRTRFHHE